MGRTAEVDNKFASFADTIAAAVAIDASYSSTTSEKPLEPSSLVAATTAMETTAINSDINNKEEEVILRSHFFNVGGGKGF